ncbi:unnamed protein product, partial [Musa acuminata subsp. burmannicoides]
SISHEHLWWRIGTTRLETGTCFPPSHAHAALHASNETERRGKGQTPVSALLCVRRS